MWSLIKKKEHGFLEDFSGENLEPLKFSNGKTQADVVKEILEAIEQGNKVIFIKGVCGTGKSAVALNLARHFDKTAIVVPIKSLQEQYEEDYTKKNFIMKKDNKKLKISVIKGRNNFACPFSEGRADSPQLPCTIEIREKNFDIIKDYIVRNEFIKKEDLNSISDVRRMSIAPVCPYWSPLLPSRANSKVLENTKKVRYTSVSGEEYALFLRDNGCGYYQQYLAYADSDVLIFNNKKYIIETLMGRKPLTDLDVIDECDEFLDSFYQEKKINLNRLFSSISNLPSNKENKGNIQSLMFQINELTLNYSQEEVKKLQDTDILPLIEKILENIHLAEDEEESYFNKVVETCIEFRDVIPETYVSFNKDKENCYVNLVTINLAKKFLELKEKTKVLVLMSGTLHSEQVLKNIFGLESFKIIEAETIIPGTITKFRTGSEKNCKYGNVSREEFLKSFSKCVEQAKKPVLVHITAFKDLPNEMEKMRYNLANLISQEKLAEIQESDKNNLQVQKFKNKQIDILFTTKCSRGIDFPGEQCNSIILTRYPYPDINSLFWRILRKEKPIQYMAFYMDKARRELLQKIYRGVRFKTDHVLLLSPDSRVLDAVLK